MLFIVLAPHSPGAAQEAAGPLSVSGVRVVFYGPSRAERDSIAAAEGLEIDDILDDFNLYAGKTAVFLRRTGIASESTDSRVIIVKTGTSTYRTIDRSSLEDPVGMILSDGVHEPRIVPGRGTDRDLIIQIREYFHLPKENGE